MSKRKKEASAAEREKIANKLKELIKQKDDVASKMKNANGDVSNLMKSLRRPKTEISKAFRNSPFANALKDFEPTIKKSGEN